MKGDGTEIVKRGRKRSTGRERKEIRRGKMGRCVKEEERKEGDTKLVARGAQTDAYDLLM